MLNDQMPSGAAGPVCLDRTQPRLTITTRAARPWEGLGAAVALGLVVLLAVAVLTVGSVPATPGADDTGLRWRAIERL